MYNLVILQNNLYYYICRVANVVMLTARTLYPTQGHRPHLGGVLYEAEGQTKERDNHRYLDTIDGGRPSMYSILYAIIIMFFNAEINRDVT